MWRQQWPKFLQSQDKLEVFISSLHFKIFIYLFSTPPLSQLRNRELIQWLVSIHLESTCVAAGPPALSCVSSYALGNSTSPSVVRRAFLAGLLAVIPNTKLLVGLCFSL